MAAKDSPEDAACSPGNTVSDTVIAVRVPGGTRLIKRVAL